MDTTTTEALAILLLVGLSAIFSSMESALFGLSELKLRNRAEQEGRLPRVLQLWLDQPNKVLASILIGNNLANITASALATDMSNRLLAGSSLQGGWALSIAVGIMTLLILVAGEVVPKTIAKHHPERVLVFLPIVSLTYTAFYVPTRLLVAVTRFVVRMFGATIDGDGVTVTEEDIETMVRIGKQDGSIDPEATRLLTGVLELDETLAREIMVPRTDVVAFSVDLPAQDIIDKIAEAGYSRYPVYEETPDKILGVLYAKDLLVAMSREGVGNVSLRALLRPAMFRPGNIDVQRLLVEMKRERVHLTMLIGEYGGIDGLVSLEDIVEEVFGPIYDEHDGAAAFRVAGPELWHIDGVCTIADLRNDLGVAIDEDEDYHTIAGLLMKVAGAVPEPGFVHVQDGWRFEVLASDETRVLEIALTPAPDEDEEPGASARGDSSDNGRGRRPTPAGATSAASQGAARGSDGDGTGGDRAPGERLTPAGD